MLLIKNISHIISAEKDKNVRKYTEMLTATISHEMMTPLNAIIGMATIVIQKLKDFKDKQVKTKENEFEKIIAFAKSML